MALKIKPLLLKCDFIGSIPQFRILDETRYKSIFSSILSILIILFSIVFVSYSLDNYIHQNPKVEYYKNNDIETNKTFLVSNSLFMFRYSFICMENDTATPDILITKFIPDGFIYEKLMWEPCELGKNIDLKYKDAIETFEKIESVELETYFCINYNNTNFTLYSHPLLRHDKENILNIQIKTDCEDYILNFELVTENDFIDHDQKDNPIVPFYKKSEFSLSNERKILNYNYQYIKYESNEGFLFDNKKITNGIGAININEFDILDISDCTLSIDFKINSGNYDYYKRSFQKFQSFLADVTSVINLLITISQIITEFLLSKKMNKDIIRNIITSNPIKDNDMEKEKNLNIKRMQDIFENSNEANAKNLDKAIIKTQVMESPKMKFSIDTDINSNKNDKLTIENEDAKIISVIKDLNIIYIIKSFFCFQDKKSKLINMCDDIINKEICVERILKRLYILQSICNLIIEEDRDLYINNDISHIKQVINTIYSKSNTQKKN